MCGPRTTFLLVLAWIVGDPPLARAQGPTPAHPSRAFVRHVPERLDDIAWENDRIAFRIYGEYPARFAAD